MKALSVNLGERSYGITIGSSIISNANKYFNLDRRVFILTDSGVPEEYARKVAELSGTPIIYTIPMGEDSKSFRVLELVLKEMLNAGLTRADAAVAVGGGVVGDLLGFAAATYMRGIDFYNIPTTLLAQVDSSIGGKTAINFSGVKNVIGAFHQPKGVLIDTDVLKTLPKRQISSGLAEALKMAITSDKELFATIENGDIQEELESIIIGALKIKKKVVEEDEREGGIRKILNFGHTLGHGIEAECEMRGLYHGECVALGMIPMCSDNVKKRVIPVLKKIGIDTDYKYDIDAALSFVTHDKKCTGSKIEVVFSSDIGTYTLRKMEIDEYIKFIKSAF